MRWTKSWGIPDISYKKMSNATNPKTAWSLENVEQFPHGQEKSVGQV